MTDIIFDSRKGLTNPATEHDRDEEQFLIPSERPKSSPQGTYVVRLLRDLRNIELTRVLHYLATFGSRQSRAHALEGGWSLHLSQLCDLRLLSLRYPELMKGHAIVHKEGPE